MLGRRCPRGCFALACAHSQWSGRRPLPGVAHMRYCFRIVVFRALEVAHRAVRPEVPGTSLSDVPGPFSPLFLTF